MKRRDLAPTWRHVAPCQCDGCYGAAYIVRNYDAATRDLVAKAVAYGMTKRDRAEWCNAEAKRRDRRQVAASALFAVVLFAVMALGVWISS